MHFLRHVKTGIDLGMSVADDARTVLF